jgi:uncharacterized damage-inducible protein DinB
MIGVRGIQELYRYNAWANGRVFGAASSLGPEDFTRDLGNSYPSVRDTLLHIVWAEWLWLQRWNGVSPKDIFHAADFPNLDAVKARWLEVDLEHRAFLDVLTDERLLAVVRYVNLEGPTWEYLLWRQMYHVVNHSTYHRGQLTTMLRQLQAAPVPTDFLVFHDELESHPAS